MNKVERKLHQLIRDSGIKCPDLKTFLHQIYKDRKIEEKYKHLCKSHPWFKFFTPIYQHIQQSKNILDLVQFIEEDESIETEEKQMFIHFLCTNFPSAFPLVWSIDKMDDLFIETFDQQSIKVPRTINLKSLCEAIKNVISTSTSRSIFTEHLTFELNHLENNHWKFFCQHNFMDKKLLITINEKNLIDFLDSAPILI
jgi:hypothetical protein